MVKDFEAYAVGFVHASACSNLSVEETTRLLNVEHPTGVTPWKLSADSTFANGQPNPGTCERHPQTHKHYLFNC